jgi:hypothetical protein
LIISPSRHLVSSNSAVCDIKVHMKASRVRIADLHLESPAFDAAQPAGLLEGGVSLHLKTERASRATPAPALEDAEAPRVYPLPPRRGRVAVRVIALDLSSIPALRPRNTPGRSTCRRSRAPDS